MSENLITKNIDEHLDEIHKKRSNPSFYLWILTFGIACFVFLSILGMLERKRVSVLMEKLAQEIQEKSLALEYDGANLHLTWKMEFRSAMPNSFHTRLDSDEFSDLQSNLTTKYWKFRTCESGHTFGYSKEVMENIPEVRSSQWMDLIVAATMVSYSEDLLTVSTSLGSQLYRMEQSEFDGFERELFDLDWKTLSSTKAHILIAPRSDLRENWKVPEEV